MKHLPFLTGIGLLFLSYSCQKRTANLVLREDLGSAKKYFETVIKPSAAVLDSSNPRSKFIKSPAWESTTEIAIARGKRMITPLTFSSRLFIYKKNKPGYWYDLSKITFLVMDKVDDGNFKYSVLTIVPDDPLDTVDPTGYMFEEDWAGHSQRPPVHFGRTKSADTRSKESDVVQSIQVCTDIYGYNYSVDDPDGGESWVETTCTTYSFNNPTESGVAGPPGLSRGIRPLSYITVAPQNPPGNPVANIADYLKCFTRGDDGNTFSVTLAIEQPIAGSRQAWTFTSGGIAGSLQRGNPVNVGHTWLIFTENEGPQQIVQRNVGFYPASAVNPKYPIAQGAIGDDESTAYNVSLTVTLTSAQFFQMLEYVSRGNTSGYNYDLSNNNCTSFALDAFDAVGVSIPATVGSWPGGQGLDPGDLGEDVKNMSTSSNMTKSTVSNFHPNVGTCN